MHFTVWLALQQLVCALRATKYTANDSMTVKALRKCCTEAYSELPAVACNK
jgi:hypothetical protein